MVPRSSLSKRRLIIFSGAFFMAEKLSQWQKNLLRDCPRLFDVAGFGVDERSLTDLLISQGKNSNEAERLAKMAVRKAQSEEFCAKHPLFGGWRRKK